LFLTAFSINTVYPLLATAVRPYGPRWVLFFDALFCHVEGNGPSNGEITRRYARKCTRPQRSALAAKESQNHPRALEADSICILPEAFAEF